MNEFTVESSNQEENDWLDLQIDQFYIDKLAVQKGKPLEIMQNYCIKEKGQIIAGIKACIYAGSVLAIDVIFVDNKYRGKGLGRQLLGKVEEEAKSLGVKISHLHTFDDTKDFYLKHGYEIFGVLEDCPEGHKHYYMKKVLA